MKLPKKYFPSYSEIPNNPNIIIEHVLRYGDIDDIKELIKEYGLEKCREIWERTLIPDARIYKLNFFLAKFIFKISENDKEIEEFIKIQSEKNARIRRILNE
ncbi:MAG: hypothetical protein N3F03_00900 [Ignavibacteria bacterium]|nr:hypothetical protein [Ignavibacteria bacterium]